MDRRSTPKILPALAIFASIFHLPKIKDIKKVAVIVHGKLSQKRKLFAQFNLILKEGYQLHYHLTSYPSHAIELAERAVLNGSTHIICVGGDGTLNEIINGVMNAREKPRGANSQAIRIGIFPAGTGNDFAKTLGMRRDVQLLKEWMETDSHQTVDIGLIRYYGEDGNPGKRYFINITDVGMGGVVAKKLAKYPGWMGSFLKMQRAIVSTFFSYKKQKISLTIDQLHFQVDIMNLVVANGKYFGGGLGIAPDAMINDALFSIVVVGNVSIIDYLKLSSQIRKCRRLQHPEVKYLSGKAVTINSDLPLPIDMDGEFLGVSPLEITMLPKAVKILSTLPIHNA